MFIKQSSLCLQVFKDESVAVTSLGGGVGRHLLYRGSKNSRMVFHQTINIMFQLQCSK